MEVPGYHNGCRMGRQRSLTALIVLTLASSGPLASAAPPVSEVVLSDAELTRLDRFEEHTLSKADQAFNKKQFRQARAEYNSFIVEFPRSQLIAYALLRKGRSAQLDDKRFLALKDYQEILDYFPNDVKYAAAALYFIGDCHEQNGDLGKAIVTWAKLADDVDYRKEPLGAFAINYLADYLVKQEKQAEAVKYYRQVAIDFRKKNPDASNHARDAVIRYYVRTVPSEPEFGKLYYELGTFHRTPVTITVKLSENHDYWNQLRHYIRHHGGFASDEAGAAARKQYYTYWAGQMQDKFTNDLDYGDSFHIERANFLFLATDDRSRWFQTLDAQYDRLQNQADWHRTIRWMQVYRGHEAKVEQYFRKLNLSKLDKDGLVSVMKTVWETPEARPLAHQVIGRLPFGELSNQELAGLALHFYEEDHKLAAKFISRIDFSKMKGTEIGSLGASFQRRDKVIEQSVLQKIRWNDMADMDITRVARMFWQLDKEFVRTTCLRTKDKHYGKSALLDFYGSRWGWDPGSGLPLTDELVKVEEYATKSWWLKGQFHDSLKEYAKAISAYQNCQNEPTNLWRIAACQKQLQKLDSAVAQVREIENFFPDQAPKAALHVAHLYRDGEVKGKYIQSLRDVLKKYPDSSESKQAHLELEKEGVKIGGGVDAD